MSRYAEVLLPLPLHSTFSYEVPFDLAKNITVGSRVVVPFGKKKYYTGIVKSLSDIPPGNFEVKEIGLVLDTAKPLSSGLSFSSGTGLQITIFAAQAMCSRRRCLRGSK